MSGLCAFHSVSYISANKKDLSHTPVGREQHFTSKTFSIHLGKDILFVFKQWISLSSHSGNLKSWQCLQAGFVALNSFKVKNDSAPFYRCCILLLLLPFPLMFLFLLLLFHLFLLCSVLLL